MKTNKKPISKAHIKFINHLISWAVNQIVERRQTGSESGEEFYTQITRDLKTYFTGYRYDHGLTDLGIKKTFGKSGKILDVIPCPVKFHSNRKQKSFSQNCIEQIKKDPLFVYDPCFQESIYLATKAGDGSFFAKLSDAFKNVSEKCNEKIDREGRTKGINLIYKAIFLRLHVNKIIDLRELSENEIKRESFRKSLNKKYLKYSEPTQKDSFDLFRKKEDFKKSIKLWSQEVH